MGRLKYVNRRLGACCQHSRQDLLAEVGRAKVGVQRNNRYLTWEEWTFFPSVRKRELSWLVVWSVEGKAWRTGSGGQWGSWQLATGNWQLAAEDGKLREP